MRKLDELRNELDRIDDNIAKLINSRMEIVEEVSRYKLENNTNTSDSKRKLDIIKRLKCNSKEEYKTIIEEIYKEIFRESEKFIENYKNNHFLYGLIGENLGHSWSKEIHSEIASYKYYLKNINKNDLLDFFKERKFKGINVTMPYKIDCIKYLDKIDIDAENIGAVNTIVNEEGVLTGYNTDLYGFEDSLKYFSYSLKNKKVLILGSGGASKMVSEALKRAGVSKFQVISRFSWPSYEDLDNFLDYNVIINTSPVGMYPNNMESLIDLSKFSNLDFVYDLIYNPYKTKLILDAEKIGVKAVSGLYMLVAQAYYASELFLNKKIEKNKISECYKKILLSKRNICLVGMPGSGKSTMGKILAETLNRSLYDIDIMIEEKRVFLFQRFLKNLEKNTLEKLKLKFLEKYQRKVELLLLAEEALY